ncbi:MAG TPA: hypothetical protein VEA36_00200 [Candidatus Paceibacterota bacterium]|nr:hypothetical protein [Candidatus Paceibacterota bacterium]
MKAFLIAALLLLAAPAAAHHPDGACTMIYQPVCGAKEVQCVRAPCYPQYQTYGNACVMRNDHATLVHEGECTAAEAGPVIPTPSYQPPAHCSAWFDGCNHCSRQSDGTAVCTEKACIGPMPAGYCTTYDAPAPQVPTATEEPVATAEPVAEEAPKGFLSALWERILALFAWF